VKNIFSYGYLFELMAKIEMDLQDDSFRNKYDSCNEIINLYESIKNDQESLEKILKHLYNKEFEDCNFVINLSDKAEELFEVTRELKLCVDINSGSFIKCCDLYTKVLELKKELADLFPVTNVFDSFYRFLDGAACTTVIGTLDLACKFSNSDVFTYFTSFAGEYDNNSFVDL
jgi:hypothetical protein